MTYFFFLVLLLPSLTTAVSVLSLRALSTDSFKSTVLFSTVVPFRCSSY
jgi:hypothetical protein